MSCDDIRERILEGGLAAWEDPHVAECAACRRRVELLAQHAHLLDEEIDRFARSGFEAAWARASEPSRPRRTPVVALAAAAVAALALAGGGALRATGGGEEVAETTPPVTAEVEAGVSPTRSPEEPTEAEVKPTDGEDEPVRSEPRRPVPRAEPTSRRPASPAAPPSPVEDAPAPEEAAPRPEPTTASVVLTEACGNLVRLEPSAMLGKLTDVQIACLEEAFAKARKEIDRDMISRVLMTNAYSAGDKASWARLTRRHLEEVDDRDPDLAYKYALYLSKSGVSQADGVRVWSDVALDAGERTWSGKTRTSRVNALYKLRAAACHELWRAAEQDGDVEEARETRACTERYAWEWFVFARDHGKTNDATTAAALCAEARGTPCD